MFSHPSPAKVEQAIGRLIPAIDHFVILESTPPLEGFAYIQTRLSQEQTDSLTYLVEARRVSGGKPLHLVLETESHAAVVGMFRLFALGIPPQTAGWEDITQEVLKQVAKDNADEG